MHTTDTFLAQLLQRPPKESVLTSHITLPATLPAQQVYPAYFPTWLTELAQRQGISKLTEAQQQALDLLHDGHHVCLATPQNGGRGLVRLLTVYQALSAPHQGSGLFLFPSPQHELTQFQTIEAWNALLPQEYRLKAALYDKDTPRTQRRTIKQTLPQLLFTLPEMLHLGILPYHETWRSFFQNLCYIVIVDVHLYHGAPGVHLAHLLRRLQRIAKHYGSHPQYLLTSLPLAHLQEVTQSLTAQPCHVVVGPAYQTHTHSQVLLTASGAPDIVCHELIQRYRNAGMTVRIFSPQPLQGSDILSFSPTSQGAEEAYTATELRFLASDKTALVLPYRMAMSREPSSVLTHTIFLNLPPTLTALHHYLASRANVLSPSLSTMIVSGKTPLERYLMRYPEASYKPWLQELFFTTNHPNIARAHLHCATAELAWKLGEPYPDHNDLGNLLQQLTSEKVLERHTDRSVWTARQRWPQRHVPLDSYTPLCTMIDLVDNRLLAKIPSDKAFRECFEGSLYRTENRQTFLVKRLEQDRRRIFASPSREDFCYTKGILQIKIDDYTTETARYQTSFRVALEKCTITETLHAYERCDVATDKRYSLHVLPKQQQRQYQTSALKFDCFVPWTTSAEAFHTLLHAVLAVTPLWSLGSANDFFGHFVHNVEPDKFQVVFADACEGGNGASVALYRSCERVLRLALQLLLQCDCLEWCVKCLSPQICNACQQGIPLQRHAGIALLQRWLGEILPSFASVQGSLSRHALPSSNAFHPLYLTLSTQKSAEEIGGWQHRHLLRLGVALTYDTRDGQYRQYTEETVSALLECLKAVHLVIGFNVYDFDYQVLQPYSATPLARLPSLAILEEIRQQLGFRLSLQHLAKETLEIERIDHQQQMVQWYRSGGFTQIVQQCQRDLELLRGLVRYGNEHGNLLYRDQAGTQQHLPISWALSQYCV